MHVSSLTRVKIHHRGPARPRRRPPRCRRTYLTAAPAERARFLRAAPYRAAAAPPLPAPTNRTPPRQHVLSQVRLRAGRAVAARGRRQLALPGGRGAAPAASAAAAAPRALCSAALLLMRNRPQYYQWKS